MKKRLCFIILLIPFWTFAQKIDSLLHVFHDASLPDTSRLKAIHQLSWDVYINSKPDSSFYYANQQLALAKELDNQLYQGKALNTLAVSRNYTGLYDEAKDYIKRSLEIMEAIGNKSGVASCYNNLGVSEEKQGNYSKAVQLHEKAYEIYKAEKNPNGMASALGNIGGIFYKQGNYEEAIKYFTRILKMFEANDLKTGVATTLNNLGIIYRDQKDFEKALKYYEKSYAVWKEIKQDKGMTMALINMGSLNKDLKNYERADSIYRVALKYTKAINNKKDQTYLLNNIGYLFEIKGKYDSAIIYYEKSLSLKKEIGLKSEQSSSYLNLGNTYFKKGQVDKAVELVTKAYQIANKSGVLIDLKEASKALYEIYKAQNRGVLALEMYETYIATRDSIESEKNSRALLKQEYKYQYEKQAAADSVKNAEEQRVKDALLEKKDALAEKQKAEIENKRNQQYALFGGLFLLIVFLGFVYNRFRITRKQKNIIQGQKVEVEKKHEEVVLQKHIIEDKNKEILDSINYAKRLQDAILPPKKLFHQCLPDSFILYKPKDIVAGDFYWMETHNDQVFFAAADCTGHGVPGAMVSVVCSNALSKSLIEENKTTPASILDRTRELVIERFGRSEEDIKDGMDIALISLKKSTQSELERESDASTHIDNVQHRPLSARTHTQNSLCYAGANNPLWIIRKGVTEVEEIKADKQPIGKYGFSKPFSNHSIQLEKGDTIYIFSDGYPDQFGGAKGKKYKSGKLKKFLISIQSHSMETQHELLESEFESWKGDHEQIDDVCVIGVRL